MNLFIFKVAQYHAGEGYEGYWAVISDTRKNAIELLSENKDIRQLQDWGGFEVEDSSIETAREHFHDLRLVLEMAGDNYN